MDLEGANKNLEEFKKAYPKAEIFVVSAMLNQGFDTLLTRLANILDNIENEELYESDEMEDHVLYKFKEDLPFSITKEDDVWVLKGEKIEKLFKMTRFETEEGTMRFAKKLRKMGVDDELERLGAKKGDEVDILGYLFTFKE